MPNVLIIDDDKDLCMLLRATCRSLGYEADFACTLEKGIEMASSDGFEVILLDVNLPDGSGLDAIPAFRFMSSCPEVIIMTGLADLRGAELAIKTGAWDYLQKPAHLSEIILTLRRALQYHEGCMQSRNTTTFDRGSFVAVSPLMHHCLGFAAQAAGSTASLLISGETGSGKEMIAWLVHANSSRRALPFVVVDCASLPESLVESTLFGHEKGAFTGAERSRPGLIKQADGGTLFLDEIGDLPLSIQKNFLRVLQEKRFRPVGGSHEVESDFRLIAATHRDLEEMVKQGEFREDLLFRIRTIHIEIPPLRSRREDYIQLMSQFMKQMHDLYGKGVRAFSPDLIEAVQSYSWPGNVRELRNAIESAYVTAGNSPTLYPNHLPPAIRIHLKKELLGPPPEASPEPDWFLAMPLGIDDARRLSEKRYLELLSEYAQGKIKHATAVAGLSATQLYALYRKHGLAFGEPRAQGLKSNDN